MVVNKLQNGLKVVAVKAPIIYGEEYLSDIAVYSGAECLNEEHGMRLDRYDPVYVMGKVNKVEITKDQSIFIKGEGKPQLIQDRIN